MQRKKRETERNWREWFETRPLVVLVGAAVAVSSTTLGVAKYFFDEKREIAEQSHAAELQQAKSDLAARIKELEGRLLSIERHVGTETIWDVSRVLISPREVKGLGSDFTYFGDLQCYLSVPKSGAWTLRQTNEAEFLGFIYGSKWLNDFVATPLGRMMSSLKVSCWRGPDAFEIETSDAEVPVLHVFPYVLIERANNRKLREATGKFLDEQTLEAKQKAAEEAKRTLDEKRSEKVQAETAATSPSASGTESPGAKAENPETKQQSEIETKEAALNFLLDSDIAGTILYSTISSVIWTAGIVKDASYNIVAVEKKGNVSYIHSQVIFPVSGTRPKVFLDKESICIGDSEDTVVIQTNAPSIDQRPSEAAWIENWLAGLRVVSR